MDRIMVGILVGIVVTIGVAIYNSKKFTTTQKYFLIPTLIFPPVGILLIIAVWIYNKSLKKYTTSNTSLQQPIVDNSMSNASSYKNNDFVNENKTPQKSESELEETIGKSIKKSQYWNLDMRKIY